MNALWNYRFHVIIAYWLICKKELVDLDSKKKNHHPVCVNYH